MGYHPWGGYGQTILYQQASSSEVDTGMASYGLSNADTDDKMRTEALGFCSLA
jgi:hypothetical protein